MIIYILAAIIVAAAILSFWSSEKLDLYFFHYVNRGDKGTVTRLLLCCMIGCCVFGLLIGFLTGLGFGGDPDFINAIFNLEG